MQPRTGATDETGDRDAPSVQARPHRWARVLGVGMLVCLLVAVAARVVVHRPAMPRVATPPRESFDRGMLRQGEQLAAIGNCAGCHTAAGGAPFAGGVALPTPFGTIHSTNITPDAQTGIGAWSLPAFRRALHEGVSRDGHLLYPAFPYDHFSRLTEADAAALYAFAMTRDPVTSKPPANHLAFPLQFRPLMAAWNLLFLHRAPRYATPPAPVQVAEWQRGAYLVDALGHCEACHTPRNALGAEKRDAPFAGGSAEGWHATALNSGSPSPIPWTADALATYLKTGIAPDHAITAGPMQGVVHNLAHATDEDVRAIAVYMASVQGPVDPARQAREAASRRKAALPALALVQPAPRAAGADAAQLALGAQVYAEACARCHDQGRQLSSSGALRLPLAVALQLPDPANLVRIVREGIRPADGETGRWMPGFEGELTDEQITALAIWLRHQATDAPPWADVAHTVQLTGAPQP
jgi:mono/diheme cytochrome c family protein